MTSGEEIRSGASPASMLTKRYKFVIFGVMAFGQFMALLDIQIVAASLSEIQAGLAAGPDEISWVQTAYLMAELVMIPFAAFLSGALSTRLLFALSAGLFTLASIACGLAWNIESMIAFRAIQGFVGGAMIPTVFATAFTIFEGKDRALVPAILGMVSVLAPTIGPTVGGIITEAIDWRWIFFINIVPGVAVTVATLMLVRIDRPDLKQLKRIDWMHLAAMATALACLQYVLEEGPRQDWFSDHAIQLASWCSLVGFALFLERSFGSANPIVRLTPFRRPTFAFACMFNLVIGFGIYASTYLLPVFLARVRGFSALQIGTTVFVVGAGQLVSTVVAARLMAKGFDRRLTIGIGLAGFAWSLWLTSRMTSEWGFGEFLVPQVLRGMFVMLCIVPSVNMALTGFAGAELRYASGLFNLMRNLGGAIGIAVVNTWLSDTSRLGAARFGEALAQGGRSASETIAALTDRLSAVTPDPAHAAQMAQALLGRIVGREALTLAFDEVFRIMAWMFLAALVLVPFCKTPPDAAPAPAGDAH